MKFLKRVDATRPHNVVEAEMLRLTLDGGTFAGWKFGREICGWLSLDNEVHQVANVAKKGGRFAFPDEDTIFLYQNRVARALWHSHPNGNGNPSEADLAAHPPFIPLMLIVNPILKVVSWWAVR
jgi:proteasome lid subunit RPN8/RPN11